MNMNVWTKIHSTVPDSKVHGANMGPTWVLSAPDGPHVGPMNFAIRGYKNSTAILYVSCYYDSFENWPPLNFIIL